MKILMTWHWRTVTRMVKPRYLSIKRVLSMMPCCSGQYIQLLRYTMYRCIKNYIDTSITILHIVLWRCIVILSHLYCVVCMPYSGCVRRVCVYAWLEIV